MLCIFMATISSDLRTQHYILTTFDYCFYIGEDFRVMVGFFKLKGIARAYKMNT